MEKDNFNFTFLTDKKPHEVFKAILNVRGWWSLEIEGKTDNVNEVFTYRNHDIHKTTFQILEIIPDIKIVWKILDNYFSFTKDKTEWIGTRIIFEISEKDHQTQFQFTHEGLVPEYECHEACVKGWTQYAHDSLLNLINTGKGAPNPKEVRLEAGPHTK